MSEDLEHLPLQRHPTQARSRAKVVRALDAADDLLDESGPAGLNLTQVAKRAGVSAGALYPYLPDRGVILEVLAARYHRRLEELLRDAVAGLEGEGDLVGATLDRVAGVYRHSAGLRSLRLDHGSGESLAHRERMAAILEEVFRAHALVPSERAAAAAEVVFFAAHGVMQEAFRRRPEGDPTLIAGLVEMLRAYLDR